MNKIFKFIIHLLFPVKKPVVVSSSVNFRYNLKKEFTRSGVRIFLLRFFYFLLLVALLADFIANDKPLIAKYHGSVYFPLFRSYAVDAGMAQWQESLQHIEWKNFNWDWVLFPPVPYVPQNMDRDNVHSVSPFSAQHVSSWRGRHWLGTDELGRDVFSGMIHGTRIALTVGLVAMGIASFLGILVGVTAGYFGDERLRISRATAALNVLFFIPALFWAFISRFYEITDALAISAGDFFLQVLFSAFIFSAVMLAANLFAMPFKRFPFLHKEISIPVDILLSRFMEVMVSVPVLFLIISISSIVAHPSIYIVMTIIGLTSWTNIARFIRGEMLRIRSLPYIEAAQALGYSEWRVILRHAIPNAISPVIITVSFGIASAILIESALSFLGVGVSADTLSWGSLLAEARQSPSAWWLAIFPGMAIFITVTVFNLMGEALTDALDPKQRE